MKSVEQLDANLKAVAIELTDDELETLGGIAAPNSEYPGWMLAQGSAARASLLATGALPRGE